MQQYPNENAGVVKHEISFREFLLHIKEWWHYLLRKWKTIVLFGLIGGALGLVYSLITKPVYTAETVFVLDSGKKSGGDYASIAAKFGLNVGGGGENGIFTNDDNIIIFLKSRTMITQTLLSEAHFNGINQLLVDRYIVFNKFRERWKSKRLKNVNFYADPEKNSLLADSMLSVFHKLIIEQNLTVSKPDKEGDIIIASTRAVDELFTKHFTESLIKNATNFYISTLTKKSQENVDILQRQTDSIQQLLNSAIYKVASSTDANPNPNPAFQRLKVPSQRRMVDVELNKAILEELVKNLELSKISLRRETPLVQIIDKPVLPLERKKVGKLKGIVLGGLLVGGATVVFMSLAYYFRKLMRNQ